MIKKQVSLLLMGIILSGSCELQDSERMMPVMASAPGSYLEYPAFDSHDSLLFIAHNLEIDGKTVRNFAMCYDSVARLSHWVAYPLNGNLIGSGSRTEKWDYDPLIDESSQPKIFYSYKGNYDRGHQCPSGDRLGKEMNLETFYFSNMTPQISKFNRGVWADLEKKVRNVAMTCDTLYVVTGCYLGSGKEYAYDNLGRKCVVPEGYYKALLRRKAGENTETGSFSAMAVYLEHDTKTQVIEESRMLSIDQLEEKVGEDFFPNLIRWISKEKADKVEAEPEWFFR